MTASLVDLRFDTGKKFAFLLLGIQDARMVRLMSSVIQSAAFSPRPWRELTDFVEVDCFEILASPIVGSGFSKKRLEGPLRRTH